MSVKDLFKENKSKKVLPISSTEEMGKKAESKRYIEEYSKKRDRVHPRVDFTTASNFARFGSAEEYYVQSIKRIHNTYPYDGSLYEKIAWENSSSYLDLDFFNNRYPRTNGYAIFSPGSDWGTQAAAVNGIGIPTATSDIQYVTFEGGPNQDPDNSEVKKIFPDIKHRISGSKGANIYDADERRQNNLKYDASEGSTVEFWLKKEALVAAAKTTEECVFDLWNGNNMATEEYGRLSVRLMTAGTADSSTPLELVFQSGSVTGSFTFTSLVKSEMIDNKWHHYGLTLKNNGTAIESELYFDGAFRELKSIASKAINEVVPAQNSDSGSMTANLGSYRTVSGSQGGGYGKLSGSMDEFRYWKTKRNAEQIGRFYFDQVGGGTNVDDANLDLGVYFKFNEGITQTSSVDERVLDYSGRLSNGYWTGYGSTSRNTGSAIVESNAATQEFKDPIIYSFHPTVKALAEEYELIGQEHDHTNNGSIYRSLPEWIISEDKAGEGHLLKLTQIMASYFDTLALQIQNMPTIKNPEYISSSYEPLPFSHKLLENNGLVVPELFVNASVMEQFLERDEKKMFSKSLHKTKNLIYQNIYNNLNYIAKSKGTEKAFRNLIRCFGVDDELINVNIYGNNSTYNFDDEGVRYTSTKKKYIDFNHPTRNNSVIYQQTGSGITNSIGYISGSDGQGDNASSPGTPFTERGLSLTFECDTIFPKKLSPTSTGYYVYTELTSSIAGMHSVKRPDGGGTADTGWLSDDMSNFQILAARDQKESSNVKFILTGSTGGRIPELSSSLFYDVYDNERWNFAVRVVPANYPWATGVSGSYLDSAPSAGAQPKYNVEFYGVNMVGDIKQNSFYLTGTLDESYGDTFLKRPKRVFLGAHRTDTTGSILQKSDVKIGFARVWLDNIDNDIIDAHAKDVSNFGTKNPYESAYLFEGTEPMSHAASSGAPEDFAMTSSFGFAPQMATLALNWDFQQVTGSDPTGEFIVLDRSSGSVHFTSNPDAGAGATKKQNDYGPVGNITGYRHTGVGYGFPISSSAVVDVEYLNTTRQLLPEMINNSSMVKVLTRDDEHFESDTRPEGFFFAVEKSMYRTISEEILNYFATIKDFNNLIGEPVNRYRHSYKRMEKLRHAIFKNFKNTPDLDKYVEYYRWIDESINDIIEQLFPISAAYSDKIRTIIESHVLERNKYVNKFPTTEERLIPPGRPDPTGKIFTHTQQIGPGLSQTTGRGANQSNEKNSERKRLAPATTGRTTSEDNNPAWWSRQSQDSIHLVSSGKADVDAARQKMMKATREESIKENRKQRDTVSRAASRDVLGASLSTPIDLGHNLPGAIRDTNLSSLRATAQTNQNIVIKGGTSTVKTEDKPSSGDRPRFDVAYGFERPGNKVRFQSDIEVSSMSTDDTVSAKSSVRSLTSTYEADDGILRFTNLHHDSPLQGLQGPFTRASVGGFGHRDNLNLPTSVSPTAATITDRVEKFRISAPASELVTKVVATAVDCIDTTGYIASDADASFTIAIPASAGGLGGTAVTFLLDKDKDDVSTATAAANTITIGTKDGTDALVASFLINAINGVTAGRFIYASSGNGQAGHDLGITAKQGSSDTQITLTMDTIGSPGNVTNALATASGVNIIDVTAFTGGQGQDVKIYAPDLDHRDGTLNLNLPRANYNQGVRRPVNIKNIQVTTASLSTAIGNYNKNYDVLNISGRTANNKWFKDNHETAQTSSETPWITHPSGTDVGRLLGDIAAGDPRIGSARNIDYLLPTRPRHESVITERFSSPGDFLTMTRGFLDPMAEEYSAYNALPWRYYYQLNSSGSVTDQGQTGSVALGTKGALGILGEDYLTRTGVHMAQHTTSSVHVNEEFSGLNVLLSRHQGQFGIDNPIGAIIEENYDSKAHYHKVHRNRLKRLEHVTTDYGAQYTVATGSTHDNWYVQHAIPRNDLQYAWITASALIRRDPFGHTSTRQGYDGRVKKSLNLGSVDDPYVSAITFISRSEQASYQYSGDHPLYRWSQPYEVEGFDGWPLTIPVDFAGMNINIYEPLTASTNTLGYPTMETYNYTDNTTYRTMQNNYLNPARFGATLISGELNSQKHPGEGSILNGILLHRNGPYGYPTWKQIRTGNHPVARHHKKNNTIQYIEHEQASAQIKGQSGTGQSYYVNQFYSKEEQLKNLSTPRFKKTIKSFTVSPITDKYAPIFHDIVDDEGNNIVLKHAYGNNLNYMPQEKLNANMKSVGETDDEQIYDKLTEEIRNNETLGLNKLVYREKIFPKDEFTYLNVARSRTDYDQTKAQFSTGALGTQRTFWHSSGSKRQRNYTSPNSMNIPMDFNVGSSSDDSANSGDVSTRIRTSQDNPAPISLWPLDGLQVDRPQVRTLQTQPFISGELSIPSSITMMASSPAKQSTSYSGFFIESSGDADAPEKALFAPATASQQYIYHNGFISMYNELSTFLHSDGWMYNTYKMFRTTDISGKAPWYDSYEEYSENIRPLAQDCTILPEFRISEHIEHYIDNGFNFENNRFLTLDGAQIGVSASAPSTSGSYNDSFFKTYSHTDFMKYFGTISEDYEGLAEPTKMSLKCSGVKKLLPYNGFYPVLRAMQLGSLLSSSYAPYLSGSTIAQQGHNHTQWLQALLQPLYAPGIMYNTVKGGVAVDFPVFTGSVPAASGYRKFSYLSNDKFDFRLPFETIIEPHAYIPVTSYTRDRTKSSAMRYVFPHTASAGLVNMSPDIFCEFTGKYDKKYSMASNNFFGEVPRFFLKNSNLNTYTSSPESKFKPMRSGSSYFMDVVMYKDDDFVMSHGLEQISILVSSGQGMLASQRGALYGPPCETFASSRPIVARSSTGSPLAHGRNAMGLPGYEFDITSPGGTWGGVEQGNCHDPAFAPFTPPYLYGHSTARIVFSPHQHVDLLEDESRQFSLDEILAGSRIETLLTSSNSLLHYSKENNYLAGREAMTLTSSMNLFGKSRLKAVEYETITGDMLTEEFKATTARDTGDTSFDVWTISTKFETPILNFSGSKTYSVEEMRDTWGFTNASAYLSGYSSSVGARMMWQGYGVIPSGSDGIFLDMKESFPIEVLGNNQQTGSLIDVCGFRPGQKRLGELAEEKLISEAVLAIPFVEKQGKREFFTIPKTLFNAARSKVLVEGQTQPGSSIVNMVDKLRNYYLPPHMDFMTNNNIDPFAIYVFEFTHILDRQELADIWQNVMPDIARMPETQEVVFCHDLEENEFFGGNKIPPETQWMVFKVKRRAEQSYWNVTADTEDDTRFAFEFQVGGRKSAPEYNYNWPYDYFSLVEVAKLDAEVEFTPSRSKSVTRKPAPRTGDGRVFDNDKDRGRPKKQSLRKNTPSRSAPTVPTRATPTAPTVPTRATPTAPATRTTQTPPSGPGGGNRGGGGY